MVVSDSEIVRLVQGAVQSDGLHSGAALSYAVNIGQMLRVRPGVYVSTDDWAHAPPWRRHMMATLATALRKEGAVFCRETALALHGVPLLRTPQAVHIRASGQGAARRVDPPVMTGALPAADRPTVLRRATPRGQGVPPVSVLAGVATRRFEVPVPPGMTRQEARVAVRAGELETFSEQLEASLPAPWCLSHVGALLLEPLALVVVDTVSRLSLAGAVVVLDAVLGGHTRSGAQLNASELGRWTGYIPSARRWARWERALRFADPRAESAGESLSRVRMAELGFRLPTLQSEIRIGDRVVRVDCEWEDAGIVGEFDGKVKYFQAPELGVGDAATAVYQEKLREDAIRATGRSMVRWGWEDLRHPEQFAQKLHAAGVPRC